MSLMAKHSLSGALYGKGVLHGTLTVSAGGVTEQYDGGYAVTPTVDAQVLPTKKKVMADDLTIKGIPYYEVSNSSGGTTVYIGEEIEHVGE